MRKTVRDEVKDVKARAPALCVSGVDVMMALGLFVDFMRLLYLKGGFGGSYVSIRTDRLGRFVALRRGLSH